MILKQYEDASSSKINFSKTRTLKAGAYENRTDQPGQKEWSKCSIKIIGVNFGYSILDNFNWEKIGHIIIKKVHIWNRVRLALRGKKIIVNQILLSKL